MQSLFFDSAPYAALLLDAQGEVVAINRALRELCGQSGGGLGEGSDPLVVLGVRDEASAEALRMRIERALLGEASPVLELVLLGNPRVPVHVRATVGALQTPAGALAGACLSLEPVAADVSAVPGVSDSSGAQADEALIKAERRFHLMADALQDSCIFFVDTQGKISDWSESAHRLHGFTAGQIVGMPLSVLQVALPGEEDELSSNDAVRLARERGQWEVHGWRRRASGEAFWGHTLLTALRGEDGTVEGLSCISRDMTVARDLDRVMNDLNAELDRRVTQRVRQHTVPNKDLDIFTHSITHDLRGPVRHINTFAGLIAEELGENASEEVRHFRDAMKRASQRLNAMIENLLTYSRIGRIDLHPERLAMAQVLDGVIARLKQTDPGRPIRWEIQPELPAVVADAAMVTDLFTRLLDNAMKFTRKVEPAEIQIGCRMESDGTCLFFIVDNGVGFDVAKASNLFLMFQRQHHSLDFEGHGAGLALCQRIVQRHNGRIWLDSTPGHGCAVYFTLPVETTMAGAGLAALGC